MRFGGSSAVSTGCRSFRGTRHTGQRRAILHALANTSDKSLEYDALVDYVADRVQDGNVERVSDEHRQRIRIALRHTHLPKLEEARIIDYETETGNVQFVGGELEQEILSLVEPYDTPG